MLLRMTSNLVAGIKQTHAYQRRSLVIPERVALAAGHTSWSNVTAQTLAADLAPLIKECSMVRPPQHVKQAGWARPRSGTCRKQSCEAN